MIPLLLITFLWPSPAHSFDLEKRVKERTLANGMKVIVMERHTSPTVSIFMRYKVGSVDEVTGNTGIAHFLEHLLFKGTKRLGTKDFEKEKPLLAIIEELGEALDQEELKGAKKDQEKTAQLNARLQEVQKEHKTLVESEVYSRYYQNQGGVGFNAATSNDDTVYMISLPSNKLELWANLESDRMENPVLREFYAERNVILEERRFRVDNSPEGELYEQFIATAFTAHPYQVPIIGWATDIRFLSKKAVEKFLKSYYSPNNAVVAMVGDIDPEKTFRLIENYFGGIPSQQLPPPSSTREPEQKGEKKVEVELEAEPQVLIGYHRPTLPHKDDYVFDVIHGVLSAGRTSRLFKALVQEKEVAVSADTSDAPGARFENLFVFGGTPRYPHTVKEVEDAFYEEIEKLKNEPVSGQELQKVVNQMEAEFIRGLGSNSGMAHRLSYFETVAGDWRYLLNHTQEIRKVTPEDIMRVARKYLVKSNRTVGVLVKKNSNQGAPVEKNADL
ncbi:MAG: insulinase family protein [Nitrospinae bacterium]|nr:insulinase family protein [Nitrospinota bacterium]